MFPVRLDVEGVDVDDVIAGGDSAGHVIKGIKEQLAAVPNNGVGYGMLRYLNSSSAANLPLSIPGQIGFNFFGRTAAQEMPEELVGVGWLPAGDLEFEAKPDASMPAATAIDINVNVIDGELDARFDFPSGLFSATEVQELADLWVKTLRGLAAHAATPTAGGFTPSDFPLVKVSQTDIEGWEQQYGLADVWPMAPLQGGMLFHALLAQGSVDAYTMQVTIRLASHRHRASAGSRRATDEAALGTQRGVRHVGDRRLRPGNPEDCRARLA